jgi:hypothetical protein
VEKVLTQGNAMARTSLESGGVSSKSTPSKPKAAKKSSGGTLDQAQKIKLIVSVSVIVLVAVFILFQQGIISLGGEAPPPPDSTPEQDEEVKKAIEEQQNATPQPNAPTRVGGQ